MKKTICALVAALSLVMGCDNCFDETVYSYKNLNPKREIRLELKREYCSNEYKPLVKLSLLREDPKGNVIIYDVLTLGKFSCLAPYSIENPSRGLEKIRLGSTLSKNFYIFPFVKFAEDILYDPVLIKALNEQAKQCKQKFSWISQII